MSLDERKDLVTSAELVCPKCKLVGCDCEKPAAKPSPLCDICPACRRSRLRCICTSHVFHVPGLPAEDEAQLVSGMRPRERVEATVREVMHCYYSTRDPAQIERIVRGLAEKVYLA